MANSFPSGAPGARRSSYASVLSGNATSSSDRTPRTSGFLSQAANTALSTSPQPLFPQHTRNPLTGQDTGLRRQSSGSNQLDRFQGSQYFSGAHSGFGDYIMSMIGSRTPEQSGPTYLKHSRHIERLQERYMARAAAQKENRSSKASGTLSKSTSSASLHKMVPSHRGMTHDVVERQYTTLEDKLAPLPSRWNSNDKYPGLELSQDGTEIKFTGSTKGPDEAAAIRTDHPIPREVGIYYYETTVQTKGKEAQIGIGVSAARVPLHRLPGWETDSWAYHGDDGLSFSQTASGKPYGHKFGQNDVIGCGVDFGRNTVFYTLNGVYLGTAFKDLDPEKSLYPSVGMKKTGEHVRCNFGQIPFLFDIDAHVERERSAFLSEVNKEDSSELHESKHDETHMQQLILQYLAHDGYIETAKAFANEVGRNTRLLRGPGDSSKEMEYEEDQDAINRQQIRTAILEGDIDRGLKMTMAHYKDILKTHENIYFKLRCRKFVELIRKSTDLQSSTTKSGRQSTNGKQSTNGRHDNSMELDEPDGDESALDIDDDMEIENSDAVLRQHELMQDALLYGQELQSEFANDTRREVKQALEDTFALIAYSDASQSSLAPMLEPEGRVPVAEELNKAILESLGKSSTAVVERLCQETDVFFDALTSKGDKASLLNIRQDFLK